MTGSTTDGGTAPVQGRLWSARARDWAEVAGHDAALALLAIARDRLPGADLREGDMERLPWEDARCLGLPRRAAAAARGPLGRSRRPRDRRGRRGPGRRRRPGRGHPYRTPRAPTGSTTCSATPSRRVSYLPLKKARPR
jgi:hypothetical protein